MRSASSSWRGERAFAATSNPCVGWPLPFALPRGVRGFSVADWASCACSRASVAPDTSPTPLTGAEGDAVGDGRPR
jgi:hypothetical protein